MNFKSASRGAAKAKIGMKSVDYFTQRPTLRAEQGDREVITQDGRFRLSQDGEPGRRELEHRLEQASGDHLYRVVMSSGDQGMTAQETERWARNVLEKNNINNYMLVVHAGQQAHTEHPHVHVLISTNERFTVDQIRGLRSTGDEEQQQMFYGIKPIAIRRDYEDETKLAGKAGSKQSERETESESPSRKKSLDVQFGNF